MSKSFIKFFVLNNTKRFTIIKENKTVRPFDSLHLLRIIRGPFVVSDFEEIVSNHVS